MPEENLSENAAPETADALKTIRESSVKLLDMTIKQIILHMSRTMKEEDRLWVSVAFGNSAIVYNFKNNAIEIDIIPINPPDTGEDNE